MSRSRVMFGWKRRLWPRPSVTPAVSTARTAASALSLVMVKGFSTKTSLPASAAASTWLAWSRCGVASTTASIDGIGQHRLIAVEQRDAGLLRILRRLLAGAGGAGGEAYVGALALDGIDQRAPPPAHSHDRGVQHVMFSRKLSAFCGGHPSRLARRSHLEDDVGSSRRKNQRRCSRCRPQGGLEARRPAILRTPPCPDP